MEALTAVSVAALTIYDMAKALEKAWKLAASCCWKNTGGEVQPLAAGRVSAMQVRIRLFATLRQLAGWAEERMDLAEGATVRDALASLDSRYPHLGITTRTFYVAVNQEYAKATRCSTTTTKSPFSRLSPAAPVS